MNENIVTEFTCNIEAQTSG